MRCQSSSITGSTKGIGSWSLLCEKKMRKLREFFLRKCWKSKNRRKFLLAHFLWKITFKVCHFCPFVHQGLKILKLLILFSFFCDYFSSNDHLSAFCSFKKIVNFSVILRLTESFKVEIFKQCDFKAVWSNRFCFTAHFWKILAPAPRRQPLLTPKKNFFTAHRLDNTALRFEFTFLSENLCEKNALFSVLAKVFVT